MRRTLSSPLTFFWKFGSTPLLAGCFVYLLAALWSGGWKSQDGTPDSGRTIGTAIVLVPAICGWIAWLTARLKRVAVDDSALYISNYRTEIRVPLTQVLDVRESGNSKWFLIGINLRHPTAFGQRIVFRPRLCLYWSGLHPVARELKGLVEQARAAFGVKAAAAGRTIR